MKIEFHFDFGSPNAYLSHLVIPEIESRTGSRFDYVPVLLGGVFKLTNNASPAETLAGIKNKTEYQEIETQRFLEKNKIRSFKRNPFFPVNTLKIMRGAVSLLGTDQFSYYVDEIFKHMWADPKKMDEDEVLMKALQSSQLPGREILESITRPDVKNHLIELTSQSVERGTFGSPTFFVDNEIFFGKDRLQDLEHTIKTRRREV
ncbi:MAG: disulfide bond formation protein DsbA [Gammaproteobacteria bacterium]|nr:disulfide bond formation protein DsbA [Gammaproteobacteria bacterium]|tara:strand:+ start:239 stop:850 length:612 start_codon:yes stop_codon:yes gene_type:complete